MGWCRFGLVGKVWGEGRIPKKGGAHLGCRKHSAVLARRGQTVGRGLHAAECISMGTVPPAPLGPLRVLCPNAHTYSVLVQLWL